MSYYIVFFDGFNGLPTTIDYYIHMDLFSQQVTDFL